MIRLTAKIELISKEKGELNSIEGNLNNVVSNISKVVPPKEEVSIKRPFILGKSPLNGGYSFCSEVPYFLGAQFTRIEDNQFSPSYVFTLQGKDIEAINISFDRINNTYPEYVWIDGVSYFCDGAFFSVAIPKSDNHTIEIKGLNKPNEQLVISGVYVNLEIELGASRIISLSSEVLDRSADDMPTFGIVSSRASLTFNDKNDEFLMFAENNVLSGEEKIYFYIENTAYKSEPQTIATYKAENWNYDNINKEITVSAKSGIELLQSIENGEVSCEIGLGEDGEAIRTNFYYLFVKLRGITEAEGFSFNDASIDQIENDLENINTPYPIIKDNNIWAQWNALLNACALYMYIDKDGKISFSKEVSFAV